MDIRQIQEILPHKYPFLLVDRILELYPGKKAIGLKNVSINEPFFVGHFPQRPIMPGVFIVEAMAQVGGIVLMQMENSKGKLAVLTGIDKVRFRKIVIPGDQLIITSELKKFKGNIGIILSNITVDNQLVAEGELMFSLID